MIMACLPKIEKKPVCYTFSGQDKDTLDASLAAQVAEACGLDHRILRIGQDFFSNFASHVDRTVYITDGYLGVLGAHEIWLNKQARSLAPIRLTGVFGGEILRGGSLFKPLSLSPCLMAPNLAQLVDAFRRELGKPRHRITFAAFKEIAENRFGLPAAGRSQIVFRTPYLDNEVVALAYRSPNTGNDSAEFFWRAMSRRDGLDRIPTNRGAVGKASGPRHWLDHVWHKATFKLDYWDTQGLPRHLWFLFWPMKMLGLFQIYGFHKYLRYRRWFRGEVSSYIEEHLSNAETSRHPFWNRQFLKQMAKDHKNGHVQNLDEINCVLTLATIERLLFRELPRNQPSLSMVVPAPPFFAN